MSSTASPTPLSRTKHVPIEKGADWGAPGALPDTAPDVATDHRIADLIESGATHARPIAGDLARTLGVSPASLARPAAMLLPIDAIEVTIDDERLIAVAHVLVGPRLRPTVAVLNAAFVGDLNMAPRSHPGDGRLDIVSFDLGAIDWFKARRRMPTAAHLPHPGITARQRPEWQTTFDRPTRIVIDGTIVRRARRITCVVLPDAIIAGV